MDGINQNAVYYDPQRDVSVSGATQSVINREPHVVKSADSYMPRSTSVQHDYNVVQYPNYYYNYPQAENDSSVQQGVSQHPGAAYQPLSLFQNSGAYVGPTSNTYYNAGTHQTAPGYATSNYHHHHHHHHHHHQNNAWGDGSSVNNHAQSYQNYTPDSNVALCSSSLPTSSVHYQQQYNQWPSYYDQSAQTSGGLAVAVSTASVTKVATVGSDYVHPSNQPPPPGTTSWKSDAGNIAAPPVQVNCIMPLFFAFNVHFRTMHKGSTALSDKGLYLIGCNPPVFFCGIYLVRHRLGHWNITRSVFLLPYYEIAIYSK
jgi:hypothetical protein